MSAATAALTPQTAFFGGVARASGVLVSVGLVVLGLISPGAVAG